MTRLTNILLAFALLASIGCASKAESAEVVNTHCPIMGGEVEADGGSTEWNDSTVGFCCGKCVGTFEEMDDTAKQAALDKFNK